MHRRAAPRHTAASFPVSKFPALAIRGARGYTTDRSPPSRYSPQELNSFNQRRVVESDDRRRVAKLSAVVL